MIKSSAKVISIVETEIKIGDGSFAKPLFEIILEVENIEGWTRRVTIRQVFYNHEIIPLKGSTVCVLIDPKKLQI